MSDGLHLCANCDGAYTLGRLCTSCQQQAMIDAHDDEGLDPYPVITVVKRTSDYMAYLNGDKTLWECAATADEAVDKLVESRGLGGLYFVRDESEGS